MVSLLLPDEGGFVRCDDCSCEGIAQNTEVATCCSHEERSSQQDDCNSNCRCEYRIISSLYMISVFSEGGFVNGLFHGLIPDNPTTSKSLLMKPPFPPPKN